MKPARYQLMLPAAMGILLVCGSPSFGQTKTETMQGQTKTEAMQEQTVQLSQVPGPARTAAEKALGTTPTDAKVVVGTSPQEYHFTATNKSGKKVSAHVLADGTVLKKGHREAKAHEPTPRR